MKQRFTNIFDMSSKKRGTAIVAAVLLTVLVSGALVACGTTVGTGPSSPSPSASASPSPSPSDGSAGTASPAPSHTADDALATVQTWAEAVKNRDGKAQYALYTKDYQKEVYDELNGLNWVTGTSSPWVDAWVVTEPAAGITVTFHTATSTGPAGEYAVTLTLTQEDGSTKISGITKPEIVSVTSYPSPTAAPSAAPAEPTAAPSGTPVPASPVPTFSFLKSLLGMSKADVISAFDGITPEAVDEGGLGFDKVGIRVWFDEKTYSKVTQVIIMTDAIDIEGAKVGGDYKAFKDKFGKPISDTNGDAHFKYDGIYLSVVRDTATDKVIAVYLLAEDF